MSTSVFLHSDALAAYSAYAEYPWLFDRSLATLELCHHHGLIDRPGIEFRKPGPATLDDAARHHELAYLDLLVRANRGDFDESMLVHGIGSLECPSYKGCLDYHLHLTGTTLAGVDALMEEDCHLAFAATGGMHHAGIDYAAGFCYVNDAVLAIRKFLSRGQRVLYVDIDAHHCDGVQSAFFDDDRVLTISFHENPETLYPFETGFQKEVGFRRGRGYNVNVPLPGGSGDAIFTWAFERLVPPLAEVFRPDVVVAVIGPDLLSADPMTHLHVTTEGYCHAIRLLRELAPKTLALGGGGYLRDSVVRALTLAWAVLNDICLVDDTDLLFGRTLGTEGLSSLQDLPIFIPEDTQQRLMTTVSKLVHSIEEFHFPLLGARKAS